MRIGILAIQHESNTFAGGRTTIDEFRRDALYSGGEMIDYCRGSQHETGGFWDELQESGAEFVPVLLALAIPGGILTDAATDELVANALESLSQTERLDGLLVAPHGAAVSESRRDFDGYWLQRVRDAVGVEMPIIGTLDPHANVSRRMIASTNALIAYRTNPHIDQRGIGRLAARLLVKTIRGEINPIQAAAFPPVAISIDRQATSEFPCRELIALADSMFNEPGVLANSIVLGFPYADVEEVGSSFIVVTNGDRERAQRLADRLGNYLIDRHRDFACHLPSVDAAVAETSTSGKRICLLDVGDNVGGGAAGDGTLLARTLHDRSLGPSLVCLWDAEGVARAESLRINGCGEFSLGGRYAIEQGPPLVARAKVEWIGDGRFVEPLPVHAGRNTYDMGRSAVVRTDRGVTVLLNSNRVPPFSLGQVTACCLDPRDFRLLVAKGVNAPIAAYRPVCDRFIRVNTPGVTCADMTQLEFRHRRRPLFPFEAID